MDGKYTGLQPPWAQLQRITENGKYRSLVTVDESQENLAVRKVAVLEILQTTSGVEANKTLHDKIDFVRTDQTAHNIHMDEMAESLDSEHISAHLLCNAHPPLMFVRLSSSSGLLIETTLGSDRIYTQTSWSI